jgi:predicted enzyme related to lactoylglutathione lyase
MPSHWTPYICVGDVKEAARRVTSCGGEVIIRPFALPGIARIALVLDSVGALVGLWESGEGDRRANGNA